jgi:hypothetical protein
VILIINVTTETGMTIRCLKQEEYLRVKIVSLYLLITFNIYDTRNFKQEDRIPPFFVDSVDRK